MPTDQPSNAPDDTPPQPRDADTAAAVLSDEGLDNPAGGGGLGGSAAADNPLTGAGGTARSAPIDLGIAPGDVDQGNKAAAEARVRAGGAGPQEPHPTSL